MKILVTGGNGFIGASLVKRLVQASCSLKVIVRDGLNTPNYQDCSFHVQNISESTDWSNLLNDCSIVIHLAALVHNNLASNEEYINNNVDATINLAKQAASAGVKRFIFLSSIGVNGKNTKMNKPFTAFDSPKPYDSYTYSKHLAESNLKNLAKRTGLEVVIIRPTLVYGINAPGNITRLFKLIKTRIPIPFAGISNLRSFVSLKNLVDLILICINHPDAANKTFLVSDDNDMSTPDFIKKLGLGINKPVFAFKIPLQALKLIAYLTGKSNSYSTLSDSLQVDITFTREILNWSPPYNFMDEFDDTEDII
jgi:UDP-glucose 4-epimerase